MYSPQNKVITKTENKREGSWNFKVGEEGEYRVCFRSLDNKQKFITFNMNTGDKQEGTVTTGTYIKPHSKLSNFFIEYFDQMKDHIFDANRLLRKISQNQKFQKTRGVIHTKSNIHLIWYLINFFKRR